MPKDIFRIFIFTFVLIFSIDAGAFTIGTFSSYRENLYNTTNLFDGELMVNARKALANDEHQIKSLDNGINNISLNGVDTVYLTLPEYLFDGNILTSNEVKNLNNFVATGGNIIVQSDLPGYGNLLNSYGVTHNYYNIPNTINETIFSNHFRPLTDGPFGSVKSIHLYGASSFNLPSGGLLLDEFGVVGILSEGLGLSSGSGNVIFLGELNSFDGPGNQDGFSTFDGANLWRNMFAMQNNVTPIPEPRTILLLSMGLFSFVLFRKKLNTKT